MRLFFLKLILIEIIGLSFLKIKDTIHIKNTPPFLKNSVKRFRNKGNRTPFLLSRGFTLYLYNEIKQLLKATLFPCGHLYQKREYDA